MDREKNHQGWGRKSPQIRPSLEFARQINLIINIQYIYIIIILYIVQQVNLTDASELNFASHFK